MIDQIVNLQSKFVSTKTNEERKRLGQFYTGSAVSDFMASLIKKPNSQKIRILDAEALAGAEVFLKTCKEFDGAPGEIRTPDHLVRRHLSEFWQAADSQ
jgi:hypothetical protein